MNNNDYRLKIFDVMRQPVLLIDRNYLIVDANNAACVLLNQSHDNIVGQACFKVSHGYSRYCWEEENLFCPVQSVFKNKMQAVVIHKHTHGDEIIFEEVSATPIFSDDGEIEYIIEELRDITELIHLKEISDHLKSELKVLRSIIPICASCKKIRNDQGYWQQVEAYISEHTDLDFTHGYCPECAKKILNSIKDK